MKLVVNGGQIENCGTAYRFVGGNPEVQINDHKITNCGEAFVYVAQREASAALTLDDVVQALSAGLGLAPSDIHKAIVDMASRNVKTPEAAEAVVLESSWGRGLRKVKEWTPVIDLMLKGAALVVAGK